MILILVYEYVVQGTSKYYFSTVCIWGWFGRTPDLNEHASWGTPVERAVHTRHHTSRTDFEILITPRQDEVRCHVSAENGGVGPVQGVWYLVSPTV